MPKRQREEATSSSAASVEETVKYWLMKSEPDAFSIDQLKAMKESPWDGVRNYSARNHMKAMSVGDRVLFYHSNAKPPGVVGLAVVSRSAYPDHTAEDPKAKYYDARIATTKKNPWEMVNVKFDKKFDAVLSLDFLRNDAALSDMVLFRQGRLSVQPVDAAHFHHIVRLAARRK
jgi:predicted RNA-binding protein with PUA-like domain